MPCAKILTGGDVDDTEKNDEREIAGAVLAGTNGTSFLSGFYFLRSKKAPKTPKNSKKSPAGGGHEGIAVHGAGEAAAAHKAALLPLWASLSGVLLFHRVTFYHKTLTWKNLR
jgi:hypothetical protein